MVPRRSVHDVNGRRALLDWFHRNAHPVYCTSDDLMAEHKDIEAKLRERNLFFAESAHHGHATAQEIFDKAGMVTAAAETFVVHDRLLKGDRRLDAGDHVFVQGA